MLKTISIESLFDIYSYTLDIKPDEVPLRFITGPNGYGKTTILNILNALYTGKIRELAVIPFKHLQLTFDDGYEVFSKVLRWSRVLYCLEIYAGTNYWIHFFNIGNICCNSLYSA